MYTTLHPTDVQRDQLYVSTLVPFKDRTVPVLDDTARNIAAPQIHAELSSSRANDHSSTGKSDREESNGRGSEDEMSCGKSSADDSKNGHGDESSDGKNHGEDTREGGRHTMYVPPLVRRHIILTCMHHPHLDSKMQLLEQA